MSIQHKRDYTFQMAPLQTGHHNMKPCFDSLLEGNRNMESWHQM